MKFGYVLIYVEDVLGTLAFYEKAFGLERGMVYEEEGVVDYAELKTGETAIGFASLALGEMNLGEKYERVSPKGNPVGMELVFVDEDVETATNKAVEHGAELIAKPIEKPWGQTVSYVRSIEGTLIEICSPMDA
ncbi:MAG: Lactoylglutathione lyase (EC [uncultured Sulfurovum sp.]|uniref:Lactoylglutathione lyase (EC) n=1 Tax=uncultured Sulfurovum sp. TaxID=269237 RepID=A0A6S6ULA4_9BACT|nr:MAG: Lactoylglutathione lyase (EC [uncultured Sulfurovum sp.]